MTTFEQKTTDILKNYLMAFTEYRDTYKKLLEEAKLKTGEWKEHALTEEVNGQLNLLREQFQAKEVTQTNQLQVLVEEIKSKLGLDGEIEKSADYASMISNANEYLKMEGSDITDDQAYLILREFVNDMDQMQLFKRLMENKGVEFINEHGISYFPKTFGKLHKHLAIFNVVNEFSAMASNSFLNSTTLSGESYIFYDTRYHVPFQTYESLTNPSILIGLADSIDKYIEAVETPSVSKV